MADNDDGFVEGAADPFNPDSVAIAEGVSRQRTQEDGDKTIRLLRVRQEAYARVFKGAAMPGDAEIVMSDLMRFCRGDQSAYHDNERVHVLLTGRQEVYLRIKDHTTLPLEQLVAKYTKEG